MNYKLNGWLIYPERNLIVKDNMDVKVEPKTLEVLICLIQQYGSTVSKSFILNYVWKDTIVTDDSLSKSISRLRRILEDTAVNSKIIETVSKKGYRLIIQPEILDETKTIKLKKRKQNKYLKWWFMVLILSTVLFVILLIINPKQEPNNYKPLKNETNQSNLN